MENSDTVIEREVLAALRSKHGIDATRVRAHVEAGVVTLTGSVRSLGESVAAHQLAFGVAGVIDVVNAIGAPDPGLALASDADIARAVRHALVWNALVPDDIISSDVTDGTVRLHGTVDDAAERDEAERSVKDLAGVRHVHNRIVVRPKEVLVRGVQEAIKGALEHEADAEAESIRVDARDGRVTLSGVVHSPTERDAAVRAATTAQGVRNVEDHLRIGHA